MRRSSARDLALLGLLVAAAAALVDPRGAFPLNDDWSYSLAVRRLLEEGVFRPTAWTAMPLLSQTLWGALFCLPGGFSFTALRLSTLVACLLAAVAAYLLARGDGRRRPAALLLAVVVIGNPLVLPLSFTFMTDVPFLALGAGAMLLLAGHLRHGGRGSLIGGTALVTAAVLCRHIGLFLPAAFAVAALIAGRGRGRSWLPALVPLAAGLSALLAYDLAMGAAGALPEVYRSQPPLLHRLFVSPGIVPRRILENAVTAFLYLGLFLGPLLVLCPAARAADTRPGPRVRRSFVVWLLALTVGLVAWHGGPLPVGRGNILLPSGAGPLTLRDAHLLHLEGVPPLPGWFWWPATAAALLGAAALGDRLVRTARLAGQSLRDPAGRAASSLPLFALAAAAAYLLPLLVLGFYDRYLIPALVPLGVVVIAGAGAGRPASTARRALAVALAAGLFGFSAASAHDYLAWNRARWQLLDRWVLHGEVDPRTIDGGFEFNGLLLHDAVPRARHPDRSWWWVEDDRYLVGFGPVPGYREVDRAAYRRWLPLRRDAVLLLERVAD